MRDFDDEMMDCNEDLEFKGCPKCICSQEPEVIKLIDKNEPICGTDLSVFTRAVCVDIEKCVDLDDKWSRRRKHKFYLEKCLPFQFVIVAKQDHC